ncbi:MAG TPA: hypothetical protein VHT91_43085 [Kofleriaceae bacterium]|nr:hypothetical protein [Kofleriaceae bacterium]
MSDGSEGAAPSCGVRAVVQPTDRLRVPHPKRMSHAYVTTETGALELCLYYGDKEVAFDEARLFPFGEQLVSLPSFVAGDATAWGPGYEWDEVRSMLESLVDEGIIKQGDAVDDPRGGGLVPSQVPPSVCPVPRMWSAADCEAITRDLGGRPIEIGHLEAVVQAYRIAHPALDADGRQVGEANVFPPGLRLDRPTEWRVCQYAGSRYRDDAPMNVTALKAMIKYWKPMLATLGAIRAEVLRRLPRSQSGWRAGDLHTFSRVVLALPAYLLMRRGGASPQPPLHPILSSLYRVIDGIRMTTHDMLFLSAERTRHPDEPITAAELHGFAERNGLFLSEYGVCAGPRHLIDELFTAVFDGAPLPAADRELPPEVLALLAELPAAVDYALLGLQVWAVARSVWLGMSYAYRAIRELVDRKGEAPLPAAGGAICGRLGTRLADEWRVLERERLAIEHEIEVHRVVYADAYEQSWRGLRSPVGAPMLAARIAPVDERAEHRAIGAELRARLGAELAGELPAPAVDRFAEVLVHYLREEQAALASTEALQDAINRLLDRPRPTRALCAQDLRVLFTMHTGSKSAFPYLFETLEDELGFGVACTADTLELTRRSGPRVTPAARPVDGGAQSCALPGGEHNQPQRRTS